MLLMVINGYEMIVYVGERDVKKGALRIVLIVGAWGGIIGFTLLGRIDYCKCGRYPVPLIA